MKLSDIKGERTFDVIAEIIVPAATIAQDEDVSKLFDGSNKPEDMTAWQWFVERAKIAIPALLKNYKEELCEIMATINDITKDEYVNGVPNPDYTEDGDEPEYLQPPLSVPKLLSDVMTLMTDSEFMSFFS